MRDVCLQSASAAIERLQSRSELGRECGKTEPFRRTDAQVEAGPDERQEGDGPLMVEGRRDGEGLGGLANGEQQPRVNQQVDGHRLEVFPEHRIARRVHRQRREAA